MRYRGIHSTDIKDYLITVAGYSDVVLEKDTASDLIAKVCEYLKVDYGEVKVFEEVNDYKQMLGKFAEKVPEEPVERLIELEGAYPLLEEMVGSLEQATAIIAYYNKDEPAIRILNNLIGQAKEEIDAFRAPSKNPKTGDIRKVENE